MIALVQCGCNTGPASQFQERTYGKGVRVANEVGKVKAAPAAGRRNVKCTCCSKIHEVGEGRLQK